LKVRRLWFFLFVLVIGALVYAVYTLKISEVRVVGLRSLPAKTVIDASGLRPGDRILWVRLTSAERAVERIPAVETAVAERSLPGTIVIRITERTPVARLDSAPQLAVDARGVTFDVGSVDVKPVLHGWRGKAKAGVTLDVRTREVLAAFPEFPDLFHVWTRQITVRPSVVFTLLGGTEVRFGALADLPLKARAAEAVMHSQTGTKLVYVDVSSPSAPASRDTTPITPAPTASPLPGASPTPSLTTPTP
jgi:cell division protein FtsQ